MRASRSGRITRFGLSGMVVEREALVRTFLIVVALIAFATPAGAQSMQVHGKTGYLGEYELSSSVTERGSNGEKEFSGPLIIKHVGLCTHDGPNETVSQLRFRVIGASSRIAATLVFEGSECTYRGMLSESYHGFMTCADGTSLPLRLWAK
jgi:hypothetical protein